ncbi:MAG TPA: PIN domain-containing protein [Anaeromyxobacteraceae bacterium]|nr:PIN domain-containing protein [Anaeromyxobacteraceae bacterium]
MRVVLDTNVVVAAHLKPTGVSARVLALVQEYREVLARKGKPSEHVELSLSSLQAGGEHHNGWSCKCSVQRRLV